MDDATWRNLRDCVGPLLDDIRKLEVSSVALPELPAALKELLAELTRQQEESGLPWDTFLEQLGQRYKAITFPDYGAMFAKRFEPLPYVPVSEEPRIGFRSKYD